MIIKRNIVAGIKELQTYLALLKEKSQIFKPESCLHCGLKVLSGPTDIHVNLVDSDDTNPLKSRLFKP